MIGARTGPGQSAGMERNGSDAHKIYLVIALSSVRVTRKSIYWAAIAALPSGG
jgi:hypothetical protein